MKRVLVTGASGFIGSHLCRYLVSNGCDVHIISRSRQNLFRIADIEHQLTLHQGTLFDDEFIAKCIRNIQPDLCYHLAWYVEPGKYLEAIQNIQFIEASIHLAQYLAQNECHKLVGIGTCLEYLSGDSDLSEEAPKGPQSLYAASKYSLFILTNQILKKYPMQFTWARIFYQFGPYENERRLVPSIICNLMDGNHISLTSGSHFRDYLFIEDVASALAAIGNTNLCGEVNIGSGMPVKIREIACLIGNLLGREELLGFGEIQMTENEPMRIVSNNRLLKETACWTPKYSLNQGLLRTVDWFKEMRRQ